MATTRITREMREDIVLKIVHNRFKDQRAALAAQHVALCDAAYKQELGEEGPKLARALNKIRPGWVRMGESLYVTAAGFVRYTRNNSEPVRESTMSAERPIPESFQGVDITDKHPLFKESQALVKAYASVSNAEKALSEKLFALLGSCNTLKQLRAAWPEGEAFYPVEPPAYRTALVPVTLTHEINQMLGIKSKPRSAAAKAIIKAATTK